MDEMARDAAALLYQLHVGEVVVCGLSMGGYVALNS
jgi:pimeloyl-ACP methyl ester carboxylesterase